MHQRIKILNYDQLKKKKFEVIIILPSALKSCLAAFKTRL